MVTTYRRVFAHPGSLAMSVTGIVARMPISMMTLGIILLVSTLSGSYGLAGQVSAAYIIGNAVVAIPHGRLADRFGQAPVLLVDSALFALSTSLLIVAVVEDWGTPWPHLLAALAGIAIPQIGAMVRGRWAAMLTDDRERHTAFSVESIGDEVVYVLGPAVVTFLSTLAAPQLGLIVAIVLGTAGPVALALQRRTAPPPTPRSADGSRPPMPWRSLLTLTLSAASLGSLFGAMEVAAVAFSEGEGAKSASGVLLAVLSFGSLLAGVYAGAHSWRSTVLQRFRVGMTALALGFLVLPLIGSIWLLGVMMFLAGAAIAPTLIAAFSLLEAFSPRSRLTEAMGFLQAGLSAGIAPGAWIAGVVADHHGGSAAFWVCVVSGALAAAAAWLCSS